MDSKCMFRPMDTSGTGGREQERARLGTGKVSSSDLTDHPSGLDNTHKVAKSPVKVSNKPRPPDFSLTSSSLPVSFSSPQPSPPRSTPPPSASKSPPPVKPKSAKALARKFETEFYTRKASLATIPSGSLDFTHLKKELSPRPNGPEWEPTNNGDHAHTKDPPPDHTHSEAPPPVPTSKRPCLNIIKMSSLDQDDQCVSKASVLSSSVTVPQSPVNNNNNTSKKLSITHKGQKPKLIGNSEYHSLLEERNKETGLVQVVVGPHFSFQVS